MTMLMHTHGPFEPARHSSDVRDAAATATANARTAMIKRFCVCALAILIAGGALTAIIALRTAIYFSRFGY